MPVYSAQYGGRPKLAAGQRMHRVLIEQTTGEAQGGGFPAPVWTPMKYARMYRQDMLVGERFAANQDSAFADSQWQMAYDPDMDPDTVDVPARRRLNLNGRIYHIRNANLLGYRLGIELITTGKTG